MEKIYSIDISYLKHVCPPAFRIWKTKVFKEKKNIQQKKEKKIKTLESEFVSLF